MPKFDEPLYMNFSFPSTNDAISFYQMIQDNPPDVASFFFVEQDGRDVAVSAIGPDSAWNHAFYMTCTLFAEQFMSKPKFGALRSLSMGQTGLKSISIHDGHSDEAVSVGLACLSEGVSGIRFKGAESIKRRNQYFDCLGGINA